MTLIVGAARSFDFVLKASDRSMAVLDPETLEPGPLPVPLPTGPKVWRVSDWALVDLGGCLTRGAHLRSLLAGRISRDDDVDACIEVLADAYSAMCANPVPYWTHADGRRTIPGGPFGVDVSGFRHDGTINYLRLDADHPAQRCSGHITHAISPPNGSDLSDVDELNKIGYPGDFVFSRAFEWAMRVHRHYRVKCPELVSEAFDIASLRWDSEQSRPVLLAVG